MLLNNTNIEITLQKEISESLKTINQTDNINQILKVNVNESLTYITRPITPINQPNSKTNPKTPRTPPTSSKIQPTWKKNSPFVQNNNNENNEFNLEIQTLLPKFSSYTEFEHNNNQQTFHFTEKEHPLDPEFNEEIITVLSSEKYAHNNHSSDSLKSRYYAFIPENQLNQETTGQKRKWIMNTISNNSNFLGLFNPNPKSFNNFRLEFNSINARDDAINTFTNLGVDTINTIAIPTIKSTNTTNEPIIRNGVIILDIPTNMNETTVKLACNTISTVKDFKYTEKDEWKTAQVSFIESDEDLNLENT
ncbi:5238_t:CDS:2 [Ambispora gerdemannii]|uniref:5238_t:CDS:1 n=1 Tax=Ambispora gerdemannii TaxID=144530 RepID=A0A9N9E5L0_9GLOM|nr:5238_t:CDS:2 [Ambispora gerdemannii]